MSESAVMHVSMKAWANYEFSLLQIIPDLLFPASYAFYVFVCYFSGKTLEVTASIHILISLPILVVWLDSFAGKMEMCMCAVQWHTSSSLCSSFWWRLSFLVSFHFHFYFCVCCGRSVFWLFVLPPLSFNNSSICMFPSSSLEDWPEGGRWAIHFS